MKVRCCGRDVARHSADPDVAAWPNLVHLLNYPKNNEPWFDVVTNNLDVEWYVVYRPLCLRPRRKLAPVPEMMGSEWRHPTGSSKLL
jgi:hypothetical protein